MSGKKGRTLDKKKSYLLEGKSVCASLGIDRGIERGVAFSGWRGIISSKKGELPEARKTTRLRKKKKKKKGHRGESPARDRTKTALVTEKKKKKKKKKNNGGGKSVGGLREKPDSRGGAKRKSVVGLLRSTFSRRNGEKPTITPKATTSRKTHFRE